MLTKTVIRSLCEGPVEDVKLILDFSNQWASIRVFQQLDFWFDKDFCRADHSGQTVPEPTYRDKGFDYR